MREIHIQCLAPYNETDHACNGGFYNCPNCGYQLYVSKSEHEDLNECENCGDLHKLIDENYG